MPKARNGPDRSPIKLNEKSQDLYLIEAVMKTGEYIAFVLDINLSLKSKSS
jgi:hypothetical protein